MNVVFLTNHAYGTPNKAGFHHLAYAFWELGHKVTFATVGLSFFSVLRNDIRLKTGRVKNQLLKEKDGFFSYLHFTPVHPHTLILPFLNRLFAPVVLKYADYSLGALNDPIKKADLIFYESGSAVCLVRKCKELAPSAKHVYRVSDIITIMRSLHPAMESMEQEIIGEFDLISIPTKNMYERFSGANPHVFFHPHGVSKEEIDRIQESPFQMGTQNCVFIGNAFLDHAFLRIAAQTFPHLLFHIIGPIAKRVSLKNVLYYGRLPYLQTLAYLKFADVGLYPLISQRTEILNTFGSSLKMQQYRYCMLPIVVPSYIHIDYDTNEFFRYEKNTPQEIRSALGEALSAKHAQEWKNGCFDWHDTAQNILHDLTTEG